ncbi:endonuclease/exonuclease/phosphatase family protein [Flavivirga sp. 57AJ16]|uniref:endonuclease/exonuclease/phosphatase family protein n=1 Tax=Flavivirga sp. 57AJ16 TaxID=3025307 RepID=UPI00236666D7|nr:endonuclease/exonuclease/phosphatase family protein [Flavivirga sp. 57AJ16]MDD7884679.1 endonuclease/exonuclease/phosphatase family protein [Flavivirga sp. 57AJ16]
MKYLSFCFIILYVLCTENTYAQKKKLFKIHTIAFYNLENLFDTINDPNKLDEFSPIMELKTNRTWVYKKKVQNMARVIADIGYKITHNKPAIIGVSEVENREVLEDLVNDSLLRDTDYGIVHFDSPDARGIDVGLLYQKKIFIPLHTSKHKLKIYDDTNRKRIYTRDQLLVSGYLEGEMIHIIINHWPSRRGGEAKSRPKRMAAAKLNKYLIDSLQVINPYAKIFIMGDLNDDPTNKSIKAILKAKKEKNKTGLKGLYNPFESFYKNGLGTTAYRDTWSLFDQIIMTRPLLEKEYSSFRFYKAGIFNESYLFYKDGRYKGYPFRSFSNGRFTNGYSDHLPAYVYVIKEVK